MVAKFQDKLGKGHLQRSQEAVRCHFAGAYLACCAMAGAAAESIMLALAVAKSGDEAGTLRDYRAARGRSKIESIIVQGQNEVLRRTFLNLTDLVKYWRDEASHGLWSEMSEFEAYEALARLLRLAHFARDHWDTLTAPSNTP